ncbi:putative N-acetylated-alpha-linked acidic dipeptidase [Glandiceps talaboti]
MTAKEERGGSASYSRWDADNDGDGVGMEYPGRSSPSTPECCVGRRGVALKIFLAILVFLLGLVLGYLARRHLVTSICSTLMATDYEVKYNTAFLKEVKPQSLESFLQYFSNSSHPTGSVGDADRIKYISHAWENNGFIVKKRTYQVLLSNPNSEAENKISVFDENRAEVISITPRDTKDPHILQPFIAYSSCRQDSEECIVEGKPVFVNYGTKKDFSDLLQRIPDAPKDNIVIMRYGQIHKANMVKNAEEAGAKAVILFPESRDYAKEGTLPVNVFPNTWWLPPNGTERGTVYLDNGDPLTPGLPSIDGSYYLRDKGDAHLPTIPVQVISYEDAHKLLCGKYPMNGPEPDWSSGYPGCTYHTGPGYESQELKLRVMVNNINERRPITNILATIQGSVEPDRYVIVGNHRDSWTYGAIDAGSGTAILMEISKALGILMKQGWKPRRTIILASWDAKEYGMIGSTEWVEENEKILGERTVAYINLDAVVMGNYSFVASGSPLLKQVIFEATKQVDCPHHTEMTVYQNWNEKFNMTYDGKLMPKVDILGSGTDALPFMYTVGIPSMELQYIHHYENWFHMYPLYGSAYDNFYSVKKFIDPDFEIHRAMAQVVGTVLLELSDSLILPLNITHYAIAIQRYRDTLLDDNPVLLESEGITEYIDYLNIAIHNLTTAAKRFHLNVNEDMLSNPLAVRAINDQMMQLERMFIRNDIALANRNPQYKHVLFAPKSENIYEGASLSGITSSILQADSSDTQSMEMVKKQISLVTLSIQAAAASLQDNLGQE